MVYREDIERLFQEDIREKKKTGTGAFHMRGKGVKHGFNGALRTPYHFMKTKEKKKLDGEVRTFNMFTTILEWTDFIKKDKETQKELLTKWREVYSNEKIMGELQVGRDKTFNAQSFADLVNSLGVPPKRRAGRKPRKTKVAKKIEEINENIQIMDSLLEMEVQPSQMTAVAVQPKHDPITIFNGLSLEYNGEYDAEHLNKIFTKLQLLVDGEENKFKLSLALVEMG